jgi:hypothetical protein
MVMIENFEIGDLVKVKDYVSYSLKDKFVGLIIETNNVYHYNLKVYCFDDNSVWQLDSCFSKIEKL